VDRAAHVHDFFPLFRDHFLSDGEDCTCQYPTMQGLPCEHVLAVLVIKTQAESLPKRFLECSTWHIESDATESEYHAWCLSMLASRSQQPKTTLNPTVSNAGTRFAAIMVTAKMVAQGMLHFTSIGRFTLFTLFRFST
jgi:hypothetical protein